MSSLLLPYTSTFQPSLDFSAASRERPCSTFCYLSWTDSYFRCRTSPQQSVDGLPAEFRQQFLQVGPNSTEAPAPSIAQTSVANHPIIINAPDHADRYVVSTGDSQLVSAGRSARLAQQIATSMFESNSRLTKAIAPAKMSTMSPSGIRTRRHVPPTSRGDLRRHCLTRIRTPSTLSPTRPRGTTHRPLGKTTPYSTLKLVICTPRL